MQELVKVATNAEGQLVVSARDLHGFLIRDAKGGQVGEMFSHWIKRALDHGLVEGLDYQIIEFDYKGDVIENSRSDNQSVRVHKRDYVLTIDASKQIAMIQNNNKGKEARLYFIDCEKKLQLELQSKTPTNFAQALLLAYEQQLIIDKQSLEIEEAQPKLKAFERVIDGSTTYTLDSVSDAIDVGRTTLSKVLKEIGWAMKDSKSGTSSTRMAEDNRYAKTVFDKIEINGKEIKFKKIVITKRGLDYLIKNFEKIF